MQKFLYLILLVAVGSCTQPTDKTLKSPDLTTIFESARWLDLTHAFDANSVYWPTNVPYTHDTVFYGINDQGYFYSSFKFAAEEHGGTHFDAPIHFSAHKNTIEQVPLSQLKGPGVVVDVSEKALQNRDYLVGVEDFEAWEAAYGSIPEGAIVLLYTAYGQFYHERENYLGTTLTGPASIPHLHFPGLDPEAARWLAEKRHIRAVGLDTPSIDYGQSTDFMAHRILCSHDITVYENVAHLDQLPALGAYIIALPMKIRGGSGAPLRIVAIM